MRIMLYIVLASCCLTLFYIAFRLIFNSDRNFFQARMFLLTSIAISLIIPFSNYRINTLSLQKVKNFSPVTIENTGDQGQPAFLITEQEILGTWDKIRARKDMLYKAGIALYAFIALILLARIILQILIL